jgi:hypothetical protein
MKNSRILIYKLKKNPNLQIEKESAVFFAIFYLEMTVTISTNFGKKIIYIVSYMSKIFGEVPY